MLSKGSLSDEQLKEKHQKLSDEVMPHMRYYDDFPKKGVRFLDIFSITEHPTHLRKILDALRDLIYVKCGAPGTDYTHIAGLESKGFVLGPMLALELGLSFVPIRKKGKLPGECIQQGYDLEYGSDTIEIQKHALPKGTKVLLVDDLLATGGTLGAAEKIISQFEGVEIAGSILIFEIGVLKGREKLAAPVHTLITV